MAEIEVDTELGTVRVLKITAAHDVGRAINPTLIEGQIEGASPRIGMALMEEFFPAKARTFMTTSFPQRETFHQWNQSSSKILRRSVHLAQKELGTGHNSDSARSSTPCTMRLGSVCAKYPRLRPSASRDLGGAERSERG